MYIIKTRRISLLLPFLSGKFNFDMKKCNKCNIDKQEKEYYSYYHSVQKKYRTRNICLDCTRKQTRDYKRNLKLLSQQIPEPVSVIIPVPVIPDGYKECYNCKDIKLKTDFYNSAYGNPVRLCKACHTAYYKKKKLIENENKGGTDTYKSNPNEWVNETQREQTFMVMEVCGWTYNDNGVWSKPGIKTKDNVWECFEESTKLKRKGSPNSGRKIKKGVWNCVDDIIKRIESGERYSDVADIYECSHTTLRTIISNYRNEKRSN